MKAPEKIYLYTDGYTLDNDWLYEAPEEFTSFEYVRKDTFIEKACVKLKKLMYDNLMFQGRLHREEVIDNFVEAFKKYMKGE